MERSLSYEERLKEYVANAEGEILTLEVERAGIPRQCLRVLELKGEIERVAQGVYVAPNVKEDELYRLSRRSERVIYSGESALYLHGIVHKPPKKHCVTVPRSYATNRLRESGVKVVTIKEEYHMLGVTTIQTPCDNPIPVYNLDRTIVDILKCRNKLEDDFVKKVMKRYLKSSNANGEQLNEYAAALGMERIVASYLKKMKK